MVLWFLINSFFLYVYSRIVLYINIIEYLPNGNQNNIQSSYKFDLGLSKMLVTNDKLVHNTIPNNYHFIKY